MISLGPNLVLLMIIKQNYAILHYVCKTGKLKLYRPLLCRWNKRQISNWSSAGYLKRVQFYNWFLQGTETTNAPLQLHFHLRTDSVGSTHSTTQQTNGIVRSFTNSVSCHFDIPRSFYLTELRRNVSFMPLILVVKCCLELYLVGCNYIIYNICETAFCCIVNNALFSIKSV